MGRKQSQIEEYKYQLVKNECHAYLHRRKIIKDGKADEGVIFAAMTLNDHFEKAVAFLESREVEEFTHDIVEGKGWCRSRLFECMCINTYVSHKQQFIKALSQMLGE
jgi:hypothetical protein